MMTEEEIKEALDYLEDRELMNNAHVGLNAMALICLSNSVNKGFWQEGITRNRGEQIALIHSELSEMLEGVRKPGRSTKCPDLTIEEEEWADALIRHLDYGQGHGLRMFKAFLDKMRYNLGRAHLHGKKF